ncbi:MAG: hypothetical protein OQJ84_10460 [Xanthomonadales bacterium]|nr:hypothetical protein [Xanthomonadales bacterium]
MRKKIRVLKPQSLLGLTFALFVLPLQAYAYLDPTTGSMLISAIVGLFASLVLAIKTYWYRIKSFFKPKPQAAQNDTSQDDDETT